MYYNNTYKVTHFQTKYIRNVKHLVIVNYLYIFVI